jgi:hypothetical protein
VEQHRTDVRQVTGHGASDDEARFLRELRQLRDGAGLGSAELAARAHYPHDIIRAAEAGPELPDLPVLAAYVRGCGGTTEEWEERWRSVTRSPSLPIPAARNVGNSPASAAGARIGAVSQEIDSPDPSIIMAALNRVAEEMAASTDTAAPAAEAPAPEPAPERPAAGSIAPKTAAPQPLAPEPADLPAGWDPIRVSTAWPALSDSQPGTKPPAGSAARTSSRPARPSRPARSPRPEPAPWGPAGTAPWDDSPAAAAPAPAAGARRAASPARTPAAASPARSAHGAHDAGAAAATGGLGAARIRLLVLAGVLLIALVVLLAVFV